MSSKNNIEDILKQKFENFEGDVKPDFWSSIESEISAGNSPASGGEYSGSNFSGIQSFLKTTLGKWVALVGTVTVLTVGSFVLYNTNNANESLAQQKDAMEAKESEANNSSVEERSDVKRESPFSENTDHSTSSDTKAQDSFEKDSNQEVEVVKNKASDASNQPVQSEQVSRAAESNKVKNVQKEEGDRNTEALDPEIATESAPSNKVNFKVGDEVWSDVAQSSINASPLGGKAPLDVDFTSFVEYQKVRWDFGDGSEPVETRSASHTFETPGVYYITMIGQRADGTVNLEKALIEVRSASVEEQAQLQQPESNLEIPNVFTPNFDGFNDVFTIKTEGIQSFTLTVFNRGGTVVFESNNLEQAWDGTEPNGDICPEGLYFYQITAVGEDSKIYAPKGFVKLIR